MHRVIVCICILLQTPLPHLIILPSSIYGLRLMERALKTYDIVANIIQSVDSKTLANCVYVCELWSEIALDVRWRAISNIGQATVLLKMVGMDLNNDREEGNVEAMKEDGDGGCVEVRCLAFARLSDADTFILSHIRSTIKQMLPPLTGRDFCFTLAASECSISTQPIQPSSTTLHLSHLHALSLPSSQPCANSGSQYYQTEQAQ